MLLTCGHQCLFTQRVIQLKIITSTTEIYIIYVAELYILAYGIIASLASKVAKNVSNVIFMIFKISWYDSN